VQGEVSFPLTNTYHGCPTSGRRAFAGEIPVRFFRCLEHRKHGIHLCDLQQHLDARTDAGQRELVSVALRVRPAAQDCSQARRIETEVAYSNILFRLRIRDDGKGIDPEVRNHAERVGHWGLAGMRERAKRLGGELDVWSEPGAGTEVDLRVSASIAYQSFPARSNVWLFWKKKKNGHDDHS